MSGMQRVPSAGTAAFASEGVSPSLRGNTSTNSEDLLKELKKEDWP